MATCALSPSTLFLSPPFPLLPSRCDLQVELAMGWWAQFALAAASSQPAQRRPDGVPGRRPAPTFVPCRCTFRSREKREHCITGPRFSPSRPAWWETSTSALPYLGRYLLRTSPRCLRHGDSLFPLGHAIARRHHGPCGALPCPSVCRPCCPWHTSVHCPVGEAPARPPI